MPVPLKWHGAPRGRHGALGVGTAKVLPAKVPEIVTVAACALPPPIATRVSVARTTADRRIRGSSRDRRRNPSQGLGSVPYRPTLSGRAARCKGWGCLLH